MNLEDCFISHFSIKSKRIGDDGALIGGYVYSKDAFFEDVHFKRNWMSLKEIAYRAMIVNISDAVAMNATPLYALLAVAMPKDIGRSGMKEISSGFIQAAEKYGIDIIGGDTISNSKLDISVTIISKTKKPLLRRGMKKGDLLAYTGRIGDSKKDLKKLLRGGVLHPRSKFRNIMLRDAFISRATRYLSSGMDISDGIFSDLDKLSSVNALGYDFLKKISKDIGCSGEEYEMLVSFGAREKKAVQRRAAQTRTPITVFAKAARKRYKNRCKPHHF
ncbi:thiamine-phosphate kinase [Sulfurimonas sp. HSL-1716]|uniref:thiamine-phosphate kinase n=1 Tax=Hydrocurvibacter sulfurireducens TaxID=3131937 RepID=UPI0031F9A75C